MSDVPDFITQVKNPKEEDNKPVAINGDPKSGSFKAKPKKNSSWCCCSSNDPDDDLEQANKPSNVRLTLSGNSSKNGQVDNNDRFGVNSPRMSGKHQPQGNAVYSDDNLLPPQSEKKKGKKCLVLDLDETLVHSSFKLVPCDFVVPVKIEDKTYKVYVAKRPHVDEFMRRVGELYEIVVFTASLAQYADPVIDLLDIHKVVDWRLFRESCTPFKGAYVKDMGRMGRDISTIMILDNSPHSYLFNRENAIPCETWYNDTTDRELNEIIPLLERLADPGVTDVRKELRELGISPGDENGDELESQSGEYESVSDTGSMEDSDFTGSSEYTQE